MFSRDLTQGGNWERSLGASMRASASAAMLTARQLRVGVTLAVRVERATMRLKQFLDFSVAKVY